MRVRLNNEFFTKTSGISIVRSDWDSKQGKVKGSSPKSSTYNDYLEGIRLKIIQISTQLNIQGAPYNVRMIKKIMDGNEIQNITLMVVFDDHLLKMRKLVGKQYTQSTLIKYKNTQLRLSQFMRSKYKRKDISLFELNNTFMTNFDFFLRDKFDNSTTTVYKHYQRFTRVLNIAIQQGFLDRNPFPTYKIRMPKKRIEFLDQDQRERIVLDDCSNRFKSSWCKGYTHSQYR